jgi:hypothetical protein
MRLAFESKEFSGEAKEIVDLAISIMDDYEGQGYKLSLRQLYYQLVSKNAVPNTEKSYKRVGTIIGEARMAGLLDWDMIEDRGRECVVPSHWDSPDQIVRTCALAYRIDKWADQPVFCEVMVEKQALEGVLEPVCNRLDIPFTANKGYSSLTMLYQAGQKLRREFLKRCEAIVVREGTDAPFPVRFLGDKRGHAFGKWMAEEGMIEEYMPIRLSEKGIDAGLPRIVVFYLGDHDPSGIDMTRDIHDRLCTFSDLTPIEVRRLALNMDQIDELKPPENPAKITDSRAQKYIARYGESSWELDAVSPEQLAEIVDTAVAEVRDETIWAKALAKEKRERDALDKIVADLKSPKTKKKK